jgi:ion channel-forming bestrophin family protein
VWAQLTFWFHRVWPPLPVWRRLDLCILCVVAYTVVVEVVFAYLPSRPPKWIGDVSVANAILLGVLLAFRNKEAYERWWEARKLWGQLINDSRNLLLKVTALGPTTPDSRARLGTLVAGFAVALKYHLRGKRPLQAVPGFEFDPAMPVHVPQYIAGKVYGLLSEWRDAKPQPTLDFLAVDAHARGLMDVCGACERIQSTPVPLSYRSLLRHGTVLYLLSAPWFMASEYGYWAVPIVALIAYFLLGTELTAEDVEDPFGHDSDDLELARYCEVIRRSCDEVLGEK